MDHEQMLENIVAALKGEIGQGFSTIQTFVQNQGTLLTQQAEEIASLRINGSLRTNDKLYHFFLEGLKTNAENMAKSIVMLTALTIEKAWNAIAGVLWGGIRTILSGAGVPGNLLPATPPIDL